MKSNERLWKAVAHVSPTKWGYYSAALAEIITTTTTDSSKPLKKRGASASNNTSLKSSSVNAGLGLTRTNSNSQSSLIVASSRKSIANNKVTGTGTGWASRIIQLGVSGLLLMTLVIAFLASPSLVPQVRSADFGSASSSSGGGQSGLWYPPNRVILPQPVYPRGLDMYDTFGYWGNYDNNISVKSPSVIRPMSNGGPIEVTGIYNKTLPRGSGGQMLADALQSLGLDQPAGFRLPNITNAATQAQLQNGVHPSQTKLGYTLRNTIHFLGGTPGEWSTGIHRNQFWMNVNIFWDCPPFGTGAGINPSAAAGTGRLPVAPPPWQLWPESFPPPTSGSTGSRGVGAASAVARPPITRLNANAYGGWMGLFAVADGIRTQRQAMNNPTLQNTNPFLRWLEQLNQNANQMINESRCQVEGTCRVWSEPI